MWQYSKESTCDGVAFLAKLQAYDILRLFATPVSGGFLLLKYK